MINLDDYLDLDDGPPCPACGHLWERCSCPWPSAEEERVRMTEDEKAADLDWESKP